MTTRDRRSIVRTVSSTTTTRNRAPALKTALAAVGSNRTPTPDFVSLFPTVLLSAVTSLVLQYVVQPLFGPNEYYIDEEFHVPQAQRYCRSEFQQWDPKITTLPGLYLLSATVLVPCMKIYNTILSLIGNSDNEFDGSDPCSLLALRAVNAVGAPAFLYYAYNCCQQLLSQNEEKTSSYTKWTNIILATSVATFPVIYAPYAMLYYTDAWATASIFLWYSSHLNKTISPWLEIVLGIFSVLCRQTNIAWIVFASVVDVCQCAEQCFPSIKHCVCTFSYIKASITEIFNCCTMNNGYSIEKLMDFIQKCWHATRLNIVVIVSFISFVVLLNDGDIVVGDRCAHVPRFHPMQLCYFVIFTLAFSLPWLLSQVDYKRLKSKSLATVPFKTVTIFRAVQNNMVKVVASIALTTVTCALVYSNTIAHPYLLADNRHYTFYAWRLLFGPSKPVYLRYLLVPLYMYGLYFIDRTLTRSSIAYKLAYWIVTPLVLCPQYLLEPRYFVVPYLMYRLHSIKNNTDGYVCLRAALIEFIAYQICNLFVMWVFLYRPYVSTMDNTGRLDRFTW